MRPPVPSADFIRKRLAEQPRRAQRHDGYRHAAVLMPLLPADGEWAVLLTRRNSDLPHHKGQVAFPGGSVDEGENCIEAALREAYEEIGLTPSRVEVLGCHDDIWTPSGFIISPVVGVLPDLDGLEANPAEVARMFSVPLSFFTEEREGQRQILRHEGIDREVFFYTWEAETIWGATALMLRNFLGLIGLLDDTARHRA